MVALEILIGAAIAALVFFLVIHPRGWAASVGSVAAALIVVAVFYPIFGILAHKWPPFLQQTGLALPFVLFALFAGFRGHHLPGGAMTWLIGAIAGHGVLAVSFLLGLAPQPGPNWYPGLSLGFNLAFAGLLYRSNLPGFRPKSAGR